MYYIHTFATIVLQGGIKIHEIFILFYSITVGIVFDSYTSFISKLRKFG